MNIFHERCAITDLPKLPEELSIAEEYHSKRENETGDEESYDVAVVNQAGRIPG